MVGAAWALTFTFALIAFAWRQPRFDPNASPGRPLPTLLTALIDARATRWTVAGVGLGVYGVGAAGRRVRPADAGQRLARDVLRAAVGRIGRGVSAFRPGVAGDLAGAAPAICCCLRTLPARLSRPRLSYPERWGYRPAVVGLFAFVWLELASPNSASLPWVRLVAADLCGGDCWAGRGCAGSAGWPEPTRSACTAWRSRGSRRFAASARRRHRHRQSVRPFAFAASTSRRRHVAGRATRVDGVRQLLGVADLAQLRRSALALGARCAGHAVVIRAANCRATDLHFRCRTDFFARGESHRRG